MLHLTNNKMFGGVCGGIAEEYDLDPTIIRLLTTIALFCIGGPIILGYFILWAVMPENNQNTLEE